ncbi:MAG: 3-deoxy-manno-octulosonate cytidylyltransferase [Myxococcota bacterium]
MSTVGLIPARWASRRFPGKPAAEIEGLPMLQRVWQGVRRSTRLREVLVATDDPRIVALCESFGASAVMTSRDHPSGTDRIAEVAADLTDDFVVNVQGDEPLIEPHVIHAAMDALEANPEVPMATVVHAADPDTLADPNRVKVVLDDRGRALYFSRSIIPAPRQGVPAKVIWQHVGIYVYRREFLKTFVNLPQGEAERAEGLEQLRALEHGHGIQVAVVEGWKGLPVDVPADVARVEAALRGR